MMKFKTAIFDLDGTLLNTLEDLSDAVNYALKQKAYPLRTMEEVRCFIGNGIEMLIRRAVPPETEEKDMLDTLSIFRDYYRTHVRIKTQPFEGIPEAIDELKNQGFALAVVSNKSHGETEALVREFFGDAITISLGSLPDFPKKPAPNGVLRVLTALGADADSAVYIGDSDVDVATAKNAGLFSIGVTWGYRDKAVLADAGADCIVDTPKELLSLFLQEHQ